MADLPHLDARDQRILGALMEKQVTVPASYPMTLNALRTACNQSNSRDPVTDYDDENVQHGAKQLKDRGLVRIVWADRGPRTLKYHQVLTEVLDVDEPEAAILTVLLLRGPNAPGELLTRTERLHQIADRAEVERLLAAMAGRGLVRELARRPGQRDPRWVHLLGDPPAEPATPPGTKAVLLDYLQKGRDALMWKLDGLAEHDVRRPLTPTGTNLLGLVKHCAWVEAGYFGVTFGRPFPEPSPWGEMDGHADQQGEPHRDPNADLYATAEETREDVLALYRRVQAWAAKTVSTRDLDSPGRVPWWPEPDVTLGSVLVHVAVEVHRHAGHADILRESIDAAAGWLPGNANLPPEDYDWPAHVARVEAAARAGSVTPPVTPRADPGGRIGG